MSPPLRAPATNRLLEALPKSDLRRMLAGCETVELAFAEELSTPWQRLSHVYFPTRGFISLIMPIDGPAPAIINAIENATGIHLFHVPVTPESLLAAIETEAARD